MRRSRWDVFLFALMLTFLIAACGGTEETPEPDRVATRVAEELSVSLTLTAAAPESSTELVTPTVAPSPTPTRPQAREATETRTPMCTVVSVGLNLRPGPGLVYDPPITALPNGTGMIPLARNPESTWLEVQVVNSRNQGWVNAGEPYVDCDIDVANLEVGEIPPTPLPPTPTPPVLVVVPIEGSGNWVSQILSPDYFPAAMEELVFQVRAYDGDVGTEDGDGIDYVEFFIYGPDGHLVHEQRESNVPYCVFGDRDGICNRWNFAENGNQWPDGEAIASGAHTLEVAVYGIAGEGEDPIIRDGEITFQIELP